MRIKAGKKDKLRYRKVVVKVPGGKDEVKKQYWKNECFITYLALGEVFSFHGTRSDKAYTWDSKETVENFSVNLKGVRVETSTEIYYFDFIKEEKNNKKETRKAGPTAEDLKVMEDLSTIQ